ncbi:olfactory receptor 52N5-like [Lepisosteus oculatus]|uniref:olfactory receptor 52N5-like n=1 Tax=Lepisosteus oculatus TaxID=7918 RepID=UPI0003EA9682|nr:PREDICTED: olfactory receptor 52N5-like [Lepisosteus oculatus]
MDNLTLNVTFSLVLESFAIPPEGVYPAFIFGMLSYCIILICNLAILLTVALEKHLHEPMYLLLINLPINDLIGATAFLPQLMKEILLDTRTISYPACVTQAFFIHIYGGGSSLILTAMAYDRYVAICCPLRYNAIMTNTYVKKIITLIWITDLILMVVLFSLLLRLPRCQSMISGTYCDNPSLLRLVCADITINNIYGLFMTALMQLVSVGTITYTYLQILLTCLKNKHSDAKSKAIQTCATHLVVFLMLEVSGLFTILSYRFERASPFLRKMFGASTLIFPPIMNPIIYGLKTKEIRSKIISYFDHKIVPF